MTRAMWERLGWTLGAVALLAALLVSPPNRPADPTLWMASLTYAIGLHWIIAYWSGGTMYGALRLQPTHRVGRAIVFVVGLLLVFVSLQFLLGFGGPFA